MHEELATVTLPYPKVDMILNSKGKAPMLLPEFTKKLIETRLAEYCLNRIPEDIRNEIRLIFKIIDNNVTLIETRPYHRDESIWTETPIAQFRFDSKSNKWGLYYLDRASIWHIYDMVEPSADIDDLLKELDHDPTGIFWG